MSKMKHLLRKLHIGGGLNEHQRLGAPPVISPNPPTTNNSSVSSSSGSSSTPPSASSGTMGRLEAVELVTDPPAEDIGGVCMDFNFLEEEFQVQLAMAISASDPDAREDPESAQIDAAKRMSLGCSHSVSDNQNLVELLSLQYWSYNVVNYDEKVTDGFYDIYGITSNSVRQGKMPLLVDLQTISISSDIDYEVILVNRLVDPELQKLEREVLSISRVCRYSEHGPVLISLIQKIAKIVVDRMGGPVADADEILRRWTARSYELRSSLNTIILPLGRLDVGLSRHRALLFKILADQINLPCMLVKGSYYTGTDDGAVNLIKIDNESEYIVDLMGAPGTLIPSEVSSSQLPNYGFDVRRFLDIKETPKDKWLVKGERPQTGQRSFDLHGVTKVDNLISTETSSIGSKKKEDPGNSVEELISGGDHADLPGSQRQSCESSSNRSGKASSAQKKKVKNVSKYVISAAKNPQFAQKLQAVLLESGASPPPDLFTDIDPQGLCEQKVLDQLHPGNKISDNSRFQCNPYELFSSHEQCLGANLVKSSDSVIYANEQKQSGEGVAEQQRELVVSSRNHNVCLPCSTTTEGFMAPGCGTSEEIQGDATGLGMVVTSPSTVARAMHQEQIDEAPLNYGDDSCQRQRGILLVGDDNCFLDKLGRVRNKIELGKELTENLMLMANSGLHSASNDQSDTSCPVLGEVAEWEIPWEDLHLGERIGIGSYGEVYRADWNGTEVAVKKFLDQEFTGHALAQLKCEVEIMLRLRHPNVVLFMGAVTRPPHFSILTEFLPRGSLYKLLHRSNTQLDEKRRLRMALDVAKGMNYLHTSHPTIVHRDLKSPNLLVDRNWVVKVCDFGLSRIKHHTFLSSKSTAGTPEWMAPEVLRNEPANEKCDVYSFGVILWELATCRIPWKGLNPMQVVGAVGFQDRRLEIPEDIDPAVAQIICDCWRTETHLRPSFSQLMVRLRRLQRLIIAVDKTPEIYDKR